MVRDCAVLVGAESVVVSVPAAAVGGGGNGPSRSSGGGSSRSHKGDQKTTRRAAASAAEAAEPIAAAQQKTTRVRTVLNEKQLHTLRTCYGANPRPDALMKEQLVEMTGLSPRVIRVWFQNKRCKDKKRSILMKQIQQQHDKVPHRHFSLLAAMRSEKG